MIRRIDIVNEALSYMGVKGTPTAKGTRWRHQGRAKFAGVDCLGLFGMSALKFEVEGTREWIETPEFHNYAPTPDPVLFYAGCDRLMKLIPVHEAGIGDGLVMGFGGSYKPHHFAMISRVDPVYVVHAYTAVRKVVENGVNVAGARILRAYRFRGVEA